MSEEEPVVRSPAVPEGELPAPGSPTVTHYQEVAERVSAALDELLALIPNFVESHPARRGFVRTHQSVPEAFIATTIAAVEAIPELQGTGCFDAQNARDDLQFIGAFRSVADKMQASATNLQFTIDARRAEMNNGALQMYVIVKSVARNPLSTTAAAYLANLKRDLGRTGIGRKKKETIPAAPAPTSTPTHQETSLMSNPV